MEVRGKLSFIQHNVNRQPEAQQAVLQQAFESKADIVFLQEPALASINGAWICYQHPSYHPILPEPGLSLTEIAQRPRVLTYVRRLLGLQVNPRFDLASDPDFQVIEVTATEPFIAVNIYNEKARPPQVGLEPSPGLYTLDRFFQHQQLLQRLQQQPALLVGDFNLHHTWWNAVAQPSTRADRLVRWLVGAKATLLNDPEAGGTFIRRNLQHTSVIDLTFHTTFTRTNWTEWAYLQPTGSDHEAITFTAYFTEHQHQHQETHQLGFNCKKADWPAFGKHVQAYIEPIKQQL